VAAVPTNGVADDPRARVAAVVVRHERALLRAARAASLCHDDALDAYQRALEIFVRRLDAVDPATELAWMKVVVRHEALAIRRTRSESVAAEPVDFDAVVPAPERTVEDQIAAGERVRRSAEALRALKPDEAQALMMKAHGLSYEEIGKRNGWTYTKVNRAITEGRRRFMRVYAGIESGEECERFAPIVEALAAGSATSAQVLEIRPHLRHCTACRAAVRDLHLSRTRRASLLWPLFAVVEPLRGLFERSSGRVPTVDELPVNPDLPGSGAPEIPIPAPDGAATDLGIHVPVRPEELLETGDQASRLSMIKHDLVALLHRANASDVATGVHIATASGGGRLTTIATVLAVCLSSVGAGTVCVVAGLLPDPVGLVREHRPADKPRVPRSHAHDRAEPLSPRPKEIRLASTHPAPTATPAPQPTRHRRRPRAPSASADPAQGTTPTSHENPPISPATATASQESFTPEVPPPPSAPAAAPATGGGEFTP
jgi:RNA polymerase sigma factor (sigma-70 family)